MRGGIIHLKQNVFSFLLLISNTQNEARLIIASLC